MGILIRTSMKDLPLNFLDRLILVSHLRYKYLRFFRHPRHKQQYLNGIVIAATIHESRRHERQQIANVPLGFLGKGFSQFQIDGFGLGSRFGEGLLEIENLSELLFRSCESSIFSVNAAE